MDVIKNNCKVKERVWNVVCPHCDSILRYSAQDVIKHESHFFYLHYIKCPCCGKDIDVANW